MIENNTVLILGAGASVDFGYPTGKTLRKEIIKYLGNVQVIDKLASEAQLGPETEKTFIKEFRDELESKHPSSIDQYLAGRVQGERDLAKKVIARILFECEEKCDIFDIEFNWLDLLYKTMMQGVTAKSFSLNKLTVITFNYDRVLQHYLFERLAASVTPQEENLIKSHLQSIPIYHIHGRIGKLPWEDSKGTEYGKYAKDMVLKSAADNFILIGEKPRPLDGISEALSEAKSVYFLGFGYHDENLNKLDMTAIKTCNKVVGSCFEESEDSQDYIKKCFDGKIMLENENAYNFMMKHFTPSR